MTVGLLICAGSMTLDNVLTADRGVLPQSWGGNAIYSALAARLWHDDVGLLTRIGRDYPRAMFGVLRERGIATEGVVKVESPHLMNVAFCYAQDGSRQRKFPKDAVASLPEDDRDRFIDYTTLGIERRFEIWSALSPDGADIPPSWLERAAGVHCAAMPVSKHLSIATTMRRERAEGVRIHVDSPWYDVRDREDDFAAPLFAQIDALLPSDADLAEGDPGKTPEAAAVELVAAGARLVLVKRGAAGARLLRAHAAAVEVAAVPRDVVDLTGAGDAFCGGFLAGMHILGDPVAAAQHGVVSASFAIEGAGISGLLAATPSEAASRLDNYRAGLGRCASRTGT